MKGLLYRLKKDFDFHLEEIDIRTEKGLFKKYKEKIPVLMIDGRMFAKYKVDESKLIKNLSIA